VAQIVYYFWAHLRVNEEVSTPVRFSVPTGNFGDIFAGYLAYRMGLPVERLILATNENNILTTFFTTGHYQRGEVAFTVSPSMDIQVASNFERYLYYLLGEKSERIAGLMDEFARTHELHLPCSEGHVDPLFESLSAPTADTLDTIKRYYEGCGYLLDPHTAVGVKAAEAFTSATAPTVCLATAHPAKFPDAIAQALGKDIARHPRLDALKEARTRCISLPNDLDAIKKIVAERT
jgi:threonine synthase